ncbi:hypothetical protein BRD13_04055 [Halobacteriales archaeon SW_5_70_135]|nr:MAG: hypothetical protein BRD13_04055 [Halobacteriales archaeon SW_5_70_135]
MHATNEALALAWLYLDRPRRTERVLRGLGRVLVVVVYVLWDVVTFGAWVFGEYLYAPAVLTSPVLGPPVAVAAFYLLPAPAVGVTVRVRRLEACLVASRGPHAAECRWNRRPQHPPAPLSDNE